MFSTPTDNELSATIDALNDFYSNGDPRWFDSLSENATVFSVNSTQPFTGRDAYREHFEPVLTGQQRQMDVLNRDLQMLSDSSAILTQTLRIVQEEITVIVRQSVIWSKSDNGWKINHLHTALVGSPTGSTPGSVTAVRVINERIATVAAVLGVAQ